MPPRLPLIRLPSHPLSPSLTWFLARSQRQFLDSDREEKGSGWYPVERRIKKWSFGWSSYCPLLFLVLDSWIWLGESVGLVWWRKMDKWMLCVILLWVPLASGASLNGEGMYLYWWFDLVLRSTDGWAGVCLLIISIDLLILGSCREGSFGVQREGRGRSLWCSVELGRGRWQSLLVVWRGVLRWWKSRGLVSDRNVLKENPSLLTVNWCYFVCNTSFFLNFVDPIGADLY